MKKLLLILLVTFNQLAYSGVEESCSQLDELKRLSVRSSLNAEYYKDTVKNFKEIAQDAESLSDLSSKIAIVSASLLFAGKAYTAAYFGASVGVKGAITGTGKGVVLGLGPVSAITGVISAVRALPGMAVGFAGAEAIFGYSTTASAINVSYVAAGVGTAITLAFEEIYLIGRGIVELSSSESDEVITLDINDNTTIEEMNAKIEKNTNDISELIEDAPWLVTNSLTLGGSNKRHYAKISKIAEENLLLLDSINMVQSLKYDALLKACK